MSIAREDFSVVYVYGKWSLSSNWPFITLYYMLSNTICFDVKMVRFKREKAELVAEEEAGATQDDVEEEPVVVLQNLLSEEAKLMEEKKNLDSLREKLLSKIQEEIGTKKSNIRKLRSEIKDLKFSCEELTKSFKTGSKVE
ncbi:MAG: hypothetical protein PVH73_06290 [Candidatus Bathyarchaeota archaeon]